MGTLIPTEKCQFCKKEVSTPCVAGMRKEDCPYVTDCPYVPWWWDYDPNRTITEEEAESLISKADETGEDPTTNPDYYSRYAIQPSYFIIRNNLPFWAGNIIKYVMRYDAKDGLKDLKKARRYLDMQIKRMEGDEETFHV